MKINNLLFIGFVVILFFISSCTKNNLKGSAMATANSMKNMEMEKNVTAKEDLQFKKMCQDSGYEWMLMKPTKDGKIMLNERPCMGCMVEGIEHTCDKEKFLETMGKKPEVFVNFSTFPKNINPLDTATLEFGFKNIEGKPMQLEVEHEKLIHVILINDDFTIFSHIHPEDSKLTTNDIESNGLFAINYTFAKSGKYLVGINFAASSKDYSKTFYIDVAGIKKENINKDLSTRKIFGNYSVNLSYSKITAGKPAALRYYFEKDNKPLKAMEPYLGAAMHVIAVKDDLTNFMHTHAMTGMDGMRDMPMNMDMKVPLTFGPNLEVDAEFPEKGVYHIFGEFKHNNKVVLTHFMIEVE